MKNNDEDKQQNRKIGKRILDFHGVQDDDETIYEAVTKVPDKKMSYSDVAFIIESLKSHFFFTNQSEDELEKVISKMFYATADEGTYLFKQGGKASCYFIVDKGGVNLEINGKFVKKIPEGVGFGEQALLYNAPRSGSCKCNSDTKFWVIHRKVFKNVVEEVSQKQFEDNRVFLDTVQFFSTMNDNQKDSIASAMITQKFEDKKELVVQGDQADSYYIIKEGTVE